MKSFYLILCYILLCISISAQSSGQATGPTLSQEMRETGIRDGRNKAAMSEGFARLQRIPYIIQANVSLIRKREGIFFRYKPGLTELDIAAISIHPEDLRQHTGFLRQPKTGIIRLHNSEICTPEKGVIQAESSCPNNITGKATAFSFRKDDYSHQILSDIFFTKDSLSAQGVMTAGAFSNLGDKDLNTLSLTSEGIKQLAEFPASTDKSEINKYLQLLSKGVQVGNNIYKSQINATANNTYVLRSTAYKGRLMKEVNNGFKVNILENDKREDILVVFRVIRKHDDGSVTLLWKELDRKESPKIVAEEKKKSD